MKKIKSGLEKIVTQILLVFFSHLLPLQILQPYGSGKSDSVSYEPD
jgi:hypothetical protein